MADNGELDDEVGVAGIVDVDDAVNKFMAQNGFLNEVAANANDTKVVTVDVDVVANDRVAETRGVDDKVRGRGADNGDDEEEEANDLASEPSGVVTIVLHKETTASKLGLGLCLFSGDVSHPRVQTVKPGSLAYASGRFEAMDIITAVNNTPIATDKEALDIISSAQGDVQFTVLRDGCQPEQFLLRKRVRKPSYDKTHGVGFYSDKPVASPQTPQLDAEAPEADGVSIAAASAAATAIATAVASAADAPEAFVEDCAVATAPNAPGPFRPVRASPPRADSGGVLSLERACRASFDRQTIVQVQHAPLPPTEPRPCPRSQMGTRALHGTIELQSCKSAIRCACAFRGCRRRRSCGSFSRWACARPRRRMHCAARVSARRRRRRPYADDGCRLDRATARPPRLLRLTISRRRSRLRRRVAPRTLTPRTLAPRAQAEAGAQPPTLAPASAPAADPAASNNRGRR